MNLDRYRDRSVEEIDVIDDLTTGPHTKIITGTTNYALVAVRKTR